MIDHDGCPFDSRNQFGFRAKGISQLNEFRLENNAFGCYCQNQNVFIQISRI